MRTRLVRGWRPQDAVGPTAARGLLALAIVSALTMKEATVAHADAVDGPAPTSAGAPPDRQASPGSLPPSPRRTGELASAADLDGWYLWLGPGGGAAWIDDRWYSTFGAAATVVRVRERAWLGALGVSVGAARWTERDGGRVWLDALVGTRRVGGVMVGASLGPLLELGDLRHPKMGGAGAIWLFAGVVPYVRLGVVDAAGEFFEAGVQLSLPALRW
jgi:hypothetical protein